ncbi:MAG: 7-cyano-7-deazaguanine synthase [Candidatus Omnitrophota bacterium]|nr:7-cyano-7-deazaguanine synthase [Candidatus Omnitrophota bacterium]
MNKKAVALLSGGLDSTLAIKLMLDQGIEVHALNFLTVFCNCTSKGCKHQATKVAEEFNVPIKVMNITKEYMEVVKNPKYPRGRNMNPCIDCRIFTFKKAKEFMDEISASFIITGEVMGQRPMSQRKQAIMTIEKESELQGLIVRPLSAKFFEPTLPEQAGIIDREKLLDIDGRQRVRQIALAKEFGINDYPCPAGGCLLTDENFSTRLKDLLKYIPDYDISDLHLLKVGRHFRISDNLKFIVGRDEKENERLMTFAKDGDTILDILDIPSPIGLARRGRSLSVPYTQKDTELMASVLARYSDLDGKSAIVSYKTLPAESWQNAQISPASDNILGSFKI